MSVRRISPLEAKELMDNEGYIYIDVRSPGEYEAGRPAGSYNVPVALPGPGGMQPNPDFIPVMKANFSLDAKLVIGCQSGNRSQRACAALEAAGYVHLVEQRAGYGGVKDPFGRVIEPGWAHAGLPTQAGPDLERGYDALRKNKKV